MFSLFRSFGVGLLFSCVSVFSASALAPEGLIISGSVTEGDGSNTSFLVIDFGATTGNTYAFEYLWENVTDGFGMIEALSDGLADLAITASNFGSVAEPNFFIDNVAFENELGDATQFWAQWEGFFDTGLDDVAWAGGIGVSNVNLADGLYVGLSNPFSLSPGTEPVLPVPEPASLALLLVGAATLTQRHAR